MKVLHINTFKNGGAANSAIRLHQGLLGMGVDSHFLSLHVGQEVPQSTVWQKSYPGRITRMMMKVSGKKTPEEKHQNLLASMPEGCDWVSIPETSYRVEEHPLVEEADIIHLHWISGFINYESFFTRCSKPIVWTLHDLNPLLGVFHFEKDEMNFREQYKTEDETAKRVKRVAYKKLSSSVVLAGPSNWMKEHIGDSNLFNSPEILNIPYGIDHQQYRPIDKVALRIVLGLPTDKTFFLFIADYVTNQRKGYHDLEQIIGEFDGHEIVFLVIGSGSEKKKDTDHVKFLGKIADSRLLVQYYGCADYLLFLSREDNLPNTILEAMASGTPVIGYPVGGSVDLIKEGETGFLVQNREELKQKIMEVSGNSLLSQDLGEQARSMIDQKYTLARQAKAYHEVYETLIR